MKWNLLNFNLGCCIYFAIKSHERATREMSLSFVFFNLVTICRQIRDEKFSVLLQYLEGLCGGSRDTTVQKALVLVQESGQAPDDGNVQKRAHRAREVIQMLSWSRTWDFFSDLDFFSFYDQKKQKLRCCFSSILFPKTTMLHSAWMANSIWHN